MEQAWSKKVSVLSFVAMFAVVVIHCNTIGTLPEPSQWNRFFQMAFSRLGTAWAVPFFFVVSGFWAQRSAGKMNSGGGEQIHIPLLRRKVKGLLVPYLLWAVIGALIALPLIGFNNMVTHRGLWERTFLAAPTVFGKVDALFGITRNGPLGNLALWYVRTLLILFLLFPVWQAVGKISRWGWVLLGGGLVLFCPETSIPWISVTWGSVGWFLLGMAVSAFGVERCRLPRMVTVGCAVGWLGVTVACSAAHVGWWGGWPFIGRLLAPLGILMVFGLYDEWGCAAWALPNVFRKTFWVYCLHGSICGYFTAGGLFVLGKSDAVSIVLTIVAPAAVTVVCLFAGILVERWFPRVYAILTGARG